jgi:uncharacterized membrane protein YcaP (DUF421 family)
MKNLRLQVTVAGVVALPLIASAAGAATISDLWSSISFVDTIAAVFGIGALVISVDLAQLGYQKVRRLVKGAN